MTYSVFLIGDIERPEFRGVRESLLGHELAVRDLAGAMSAVADRGQEPDLVILLQTWPGEFDRTQFEQLRRLAPLARVITVLGSWCEGETRSGTPLPGTTRLYWHQWPGRSPWDERHILVGTCPLWALPVTATEEDRLLWSARRPHSPLPGDGVDKGSVGIITSRRPMWDWLADACRKLGYQPVWLRAGQGTPAELSAIVWDCNSDARVRPPTNHGLEAHATWHGLPARDCPAEESHLEILAALPERPPVIALCTFPRAEDQSRLAPLGVTALLGKPLGLDELACSLAQLTGSRSNRYD